MFRQYRLSSTLYCLFYYRYAMKYILAFFLCCSGSALQAQGNDKPSFPIDSLYELPQLFFLDTDTIIKWIEAGKKHEISSQQTADFLEKVHRLERRFEIPLSEALVFENKQDISSQEYDDVERFIAISDIHGQYGTFVKFLQQQQVIDEKQNWIYGKGHLIINGDILDRGIGVTEALWLVFKLQQQAAAHGGKVHYTLGNHELMVLDNDLRYIHDKYAVAQDILEKSYHEQFSPQSFFGQWIRQNPVMVKVNKTGFVHAGISPEVIERALTPARINQLFSDSIYTQEKDTYRKSELLNFLVRTNGPAWYRGYFKDDDLTNKDIEKMLQWWGVDRIVVGHTSQKNILSLFGGRVIAIDSSVKYGDRGEVLIYDEGNFFRGFINGKRKRLR